MKVCICQSCKRICRVRNEDEKIWVINCNAFVPDFTERYNRTIQTFFNKEIIEC